MQKERALIKDHLIPTRAATQGKRNQRRKSPRGTAGCRGARVMEKGKEGVRESLECGRERGGRGFRGERNPQRRKSPLDFFAGQFSRRALLNAD
jgi:hypothetical protein